MTSWPKDHGYARVGLNLCFLAMVLIGLTNFVTAVLGRYQRPSILIPDATHDAFTKALVRVGVLAVPGDPRSFATHGTAFSIGKLGSNPRWVYFLTSQDPLSRRDCRLQWQPSETELCTTTAWVIDHAHGVALLRSDVDGHTPPRVLQLRDSSVEITSEPVTTFGFARGKIRARQTMVDYVPQENQQQGHQLQLRDRCPFDAFGSFRGAPLLDDQGEVLGVYVRGRSPGVGVTSSEIARLLRRLDL